MGRPYRSLPFPTPILRVLPFQPRRGLELRLPRLQMAPARTQCFATPVFRRPALSRPPPAASTAALQSLLTYPGRCARGETVSAPAADETGQRQVIVHLPPRDPRPIYPKEQALIDLIQQEKSQGRRTLVYSTHTDVRDLTGRIRQFLERAGIRAAVRVHGPSSSNTRPSHVGQPSGSRFSQRHSVLFTAPTQPLAAA